MSDSPRGVLKRNQVRVGGPYRVAGGPAARPEPGDAEARIVDVEGSEAILEVRCVCGRLTYVRCRWAAPAPAAPPAAGAAKAPAPGAAKA